MIKRGNIWNSIRQISLGYGLLLPLILVIADQLSKWAATSAFDQPMSICASNPMIRVTRDISPVVDLSLLCNPGVSWGLLQGDSDLKRWALLVFAVIMVIFLYAALSSARDWLSKLSLSLVIGGAIGNAIDRALFGAVTDFIDASDIGFYYVFNIADSAISIGVTGLVIILIRDMIADRKAKKAKVDEKADETAK